MDYKVTETCAHDSSLARLLEAGKHISLDTAHAVSFITRSSGDLTLLQHSMSSAIEALAVNRDAEALKMLLYYLQTSPEACKRVYAIFTRITIHDVVPDLEALSVQESLGNDKNSLIKEYEAYLFLLSRCTMPVHASATVVRAALTQLAATSTPEYVQELVTLISNQVSLLRAEDEVFSFETVMYLVSRLDEALRREGFRLWCTMVENGSPNLVTQVAVANKVEYFDHLRIQVGRSDKYALRILQVTLEKLEQAVTTQTMAYDPEDPVSKVFWSRLISLVEILSLDASFHQMVDSMPDFVGILRPGSPVPIDWKLELVNIGLIVSNTESIRNYTMEMLMGMSSSDLESLARRPEYIVQNLFPRFTRPSCFVVVNDRCLQAEHLRDFTRNYSQACITAKSLKVFFKSLVQLFCENSHAVEAPRVVIIGALRDALQSFPGEREKLDKEDVKSLLAFASASHDTYHNYDVAYTMSQLIRDMFPTEGNGSKTNWNYGIPNPSLREDLSLEVLDGTDVVNEDNKLLLRRFWFEIQSLGFVSRKLRDYINGLEGPQRKSFDECLSAVKHKEPETLIDAVLRMQQPDCNQSDILFMLQKELTHPPHLSPKGRLLQAYAVEHAVAVAWPLLDFDIYEKIFESFTVYHTRLMVLRCLKYETRSLTSLQLRQLWAHIKSNGLRSKDRELHQNFIELVARQDCDSTEICEEIIDVCTKRWFLLYTLARALKERVIDRKSREKWVWRILLQIFVFLPSDDSFLRFEAMVVQHSCYPGCTDVPDDLARPLVAEVLYSLEDAQVSEDLARFVFEKANFRQRISGSLDSVQSHKRALYYQALILLQRHGWSQEFVDLVQNTLKEPLADEMNPVSRLHGDWLLALLLNRREPKDGAFVNICLDGLQPVSQKAPRVVSSIIRRSVLIYLANRNDGCAAEFGHKLVNQLTASAASCRAAVRHSSVAALYSLKIAGLIPEPQRDMVACIVELNKQGLQMSHSQYDTYVWDILDTKIGPICGGVSSAFFGRTMHNTLLRENFIGVPESILGTCWDPKNGTPKEELLLPAGIQARQNAVSHACDPETSSQSALIQTKASAMSVESRAERTELIVVATLCDKPVNLGAICRLSDALGAQKLTIADKRTLQDGNFKSTSLTAEKWIPIAEVPENQLAIYLKELKMQGYYIVGIEQTDTSKVLKPSLHFPSRVALIMGHEKQGIPANLLCLLDGCVEIEQKGYVRSMNIQTATAIVVHAYNNQHSANVKSLEYRDGKEF